LRPEETPVSEPVATRADDEKTMPMVVYALYLIGLVNGLTILIGFIMAYALKGGAGPIARTHYVFLIRTVWIALAWCLLAGVIMVIGLPLTLVLIGFLFLKLGLVIFALTGIWFVVRSVVGLIFASRGDPYPRPGAWLI
jgi:uncharacterized membrane protein